MDNRRHMNVLLYSKFSQACRKFIEIMETVPIFKENTSIVCIDNKDIRKRILESEKLKINEVPSVLRVYQDNGYVETFEGDKAFMLLNTYIEELRKMNTSHASQLPSQPSQNLPPQPLLPENSTQKSSQSQIENNVSQLRPPSKPQQMSMKQHLLSLNELEDVEEPNQNIQISKQPTPPPMLPSQPPQQSSLKSSSQILSDIDMENQQRSAPDRSIKSGGGGNIVLLAQKMQKEREQESSTPGQGMRAI